LAEEDTSDTADERPAELTLSTDDGFVLRRLPAAVQVEVEEVVSELQQLFLAYSVGESDLSRISFDADADAYDDAYDDARGGEEGGEEGGGAGGGAGVGGAGGAACGGGAAGHCMGSPGSILRDPDAPGTGTPFDAARQGGMRMR
jgi:hypothetical protein